MAEGLLRARGGDHYEVFSAGIVATQVRPEAIAVMAEIGIDISDHSSKLLDLFWGQIFDEVITVCDDANDACPFFPGARNRIHWSIEDPSAVEGSLDLRMESFRTARDDLAKRIIRTFG